MSIPSPSDPSIGRRRPTINDIARLASVSKKTVSRVINASPSVSEETRRRVSAVIDELGFTPDPHARGLAFRRSSLIGFVYDNPNPQYVVNAQQGILDTARAAGFELVVRPADRRAPDFLADMRAFVERQRLFGVILFPSMSEDEGLAALLRELQCPYARVASVALDDPARMVVTHDSEGAAQAARRLAQLGHTRIGIVTGPAAFRSAHVRREGFAAGLAECGLKGDSVLPAEGAYTFESGLACGRALLDRPDRPTAIFALNDEMAAGVYRAARDLGLEIPRDLSVIGFDDSPIAARLWPPLTTVLLPIREMGRLAALTLIGGGDGGESEGRRISPTLVERDSTAAPKPR